MNRLLAVLILPLSILASAQPALAQSCSFTIGDINFGSIDVTTNVPFTASATFTANCTGTNGRFVRVCPNFGTGTGSTTDYDPRKLASGASLMSYNLFQDSAYSTIWGSHLWGYPPTPPTIDIHLTGGGSGSASATIYARIPAGQTSLPSGVYSSSFSGSHTAIAYAYRSVGSCATIGSTNATQVPFTVTANNAITCAVTASDLNFGSVTTLSSNHDVNGSASVTCSNLAPYRVLLDNGLTGTGPTNRKMTLGADSVTYALYRDAARTLAWGNTSGVDSLSGTGTGGAQSLTIYGRVPAQAVPPPGLYSDTVVITVEY
jgi:spore coat protein U-like protein